MPRTASLGERLFTEYIAQSAAGIPHADACDHAEHTAKLA
jgi:hypothetical protein